MLQIYWSAEAKDSYAAILQHVVDRFSSDAAIKMDDKVERLLALLQQNRHLCPPALNFPDLRRCVITPQLSLIYRLIKDEIELVVFLDNRTGIVF